MRMALRMATNSPLTVEVEADDGPLDGVDHAEGLAVPPERGGSAGLGVLGHG
jgi:hypothetical protein